MICEANFSLPQKLDILLEKEKSNATEKDGKHDDHVDKPNILFEQKEYNILPKFTGQFDHLNPVLSLRTNNYFACRWNQFLDHAPSNYVHIRLYRDYINTVRSKNARRKSLNGQFYGVDNKLAPIPVMPDRSKVPKYNKGQAESTYQTQVEKPRNDISASNLKKFKCK